MWSGLLSLEQVSNLANLQTLSSARLSTSQGASSAPGPNGVSYRVYKYCPQIRAVLFSLLRSSLDFWQHPLRLAGGGGMPYSQGCKRCSNPTTSVTFPFLTWKGRSSLSLLQGACKTSCHVTSYVDTRVQKGATSGCPGVLEHVASLFDMVGEARRNRKTLHVVFCDVANAFGSIPHHVIFGALAHYHIPERVRTLLEQYYNNLFYRVSTGGFTSALQRLERGIMMGCSVSPILFVTAFNLCLQGDAGRDTFTVRGKPAPAMKSYVDDVAICTSSLIGAKRLLLDFNTKVERLGMRLKPTKCRSLSICAGRPVDREFFKIGDASLPTAIQKPTKFLGRFVDAYGRGRNRFEELKQELVWILTRIDRSALNGARKLWCWHFVGLARFRWKLLVYDIALTNVEQLDTLCTKFIRKWLCLSRSLSTCALYGSLDKLRLPISSILTEYKASTVQWQLQVDASPDPVLSGVVVGKAGRKWSSSQAKDDALSSLMWKEMCRGQSSRVGLGVKKHVLLSKLRGKRSAPSSG